MLTSFNKIVLGISSVILIIALVIIGTLIAKSMSEQSFPPVISDCPDYWDVTYDNDNNLVCKNISTINRGRSEFNNYPVALFNNRGTTIGDTMCEKFKWAKKADVTWDGITNNNKACETTTI